MRAFDDLVREAEAAPVDSWDFSWLDGRAIEERPSWRYFDRVVERVADVRSLLEVQAGTGSMLGSLPSPPPLAVATEGHPPSVAVAAPRLRARGAHLVVTSQTTAGLPFAGNTFDLVVSRHPIAPWWSEIARVLGPGGRYVAQHVGPGSLRTLGERFTGPWPERSERDPLVERQAAEAAGLAVEVLEVERPRTAFYDIGAVVHFLRLVPWIVPGFRAGRHERELRELHEEIERDGAFETTASRMLVIASKR